MTVFQTGGPLNPHEHRDIIVHRPELDRILTHIESADPYVALRGSRQTGKTTLLYQIQDRLHERGYGVVHLELSWRSNLNKAEFYQAICTDIRDQLSELPDGVSKDVLDFRHITDQDAFSDYLTRLSAHILWARKLIIMLDGIEGVSEEVSSTFFPSLRRFFHEGRRPSKGRDVYRKIMFIFSGALGLQRLSQGANSPLQNICAPFSLSDFSQEDVHKLASNLRGFPPEHMEAIADAVYRWCDGYPYLTQRLYALIDETQACRGAKVYQLSEVVDGLVEDRILYADDPNLIHTINYLSIVSHFSEPIFNKME